MFRVLTALVTLVVASAACAERRRAATPVAQSALAPGSHTIALRHDGRARSYIAHIPRAGGAARARAVLLAFHGGGGEAAGFAAYAGLDALAEREGFIAVYPFGSGVLPQRLLTWNAGECCGYAMNQRVDDVGFTMAILDDLARRVNVDPSRIYATGHSNGAMMVYRLAAERADRIAAIVPVGGAYNLAELRPSRPVAVLHIHSADDPRALYDGGEGPPFPGTNVRSRHRPVMAGLTQWARSNGCTTGAAPRVVETREGRAATRDAGQTATLYAWQGCARGGDVSHWKLTGVGHGWPGNARAELREELIGPPTTLVVAADEVWRFVSAVRR